MAVMLTGREPVDVPVQRCGVDVAGAVLPERRQRVDSQAGRLVAARALRREPHGEDVGPAVVAVDVASVQGRQPRIAHHVAADEGAEARRVAWSELRRNGAGGPSGAVAVKALEDAPPVVGAAARSLLLEVDLLEQVLADVADREGAGQAGEAEAG